MGESQVVNALRAEGELAASRASVLRALELRFGTPIPDNLRVALEAEADLIEVRRCLDAAITASTLVEFRATVQR
jgi:hypothetical protein